MDAPGTVGQLTLLTAESHLASPNPRKPHKLRGPPPAIEDSAVSHSVHLPYPSASAVSSRNALSVRYSLSSFLCQTLPERPMAASLRLSLSLNFHLPPGTSDDEFRICVEGALMPCLRLMESSDFWYCSIHISGLLLEWLEQHRPAALSRLRILVETERVEILGGALYQPILAGIPAADRIGQIELCAHRIDEVFCCESRGMLLAQDVWDESLPQDIFDAGLQYVILNEAHFVSVGKEENFRTGCYAAESAGRTIALLPSCNALLSLPATVTPAEFLDQLRPHDHEDRSIILPIEGSLLISSDEFGAEISAINWLTEFLKLLSDSRSWLQTSTPSQLLDNQSPAGSFSPLAGIPRTVVTPGTDTPVTEIVSWRNLRYQWQESLDMYSRMIEVSRQLARICSSDILLDTHRQTVETARRHLYRGQCHNAYWSDSGSGLFCPRLRDAVYHELITAENLLLQIERSSATWISGEIEDFNFDLRQEVKINNHRISAMFSPAVGGHLTQLDVRTPAINLQAAFSCPPLPQDASAIVSEGTDLEPKTHEPAARFWPRRILVDHFLQPDLTLVEFQCQQGLISDFETALYNAVLHEGETRIALEMNATGLVEEKPTTIRKTIMASLDRPGELLIQYCLGGTEPGATIHFGVEFNFSSLSSGTDESYFYDSDGQPQGGLNETLILRQTDRVCMIDEALGVDVSLELADVADFWIFPILTTTDQAPEQQSICVVPHWQFVMPASGQITLEMRLLIDSSIAQARKLADTHEQQSKASGSQFKSHTPVGQ